MRERQPTLPTLRELFELAKKNAKRVFMVDGSIAPIWHAVPTDPAADHLLICSPWGDDDEKDMALDAIRDMFREHHVLRFVLVTEAWAVMGCKLENVTDIRPSRHPDRREIIRISAEDRDGSTLSGQYYILRPEHGPVALSPFKEDTHDMIQAGRMSGMLADTRH